MKTYVQTRYRNSSFQTIVATIINEMNQNATKWSAPTKTVFNKRCFGQDVSVLRNFYSPNEPIQVFVNMKEIENLTEKESRILCAEFGYLREKFDKYIGKTQDLNEQKRKNKNVKYS